MSFMTVTSLSGLMNCICHAKEASGYAAMSGNWKNKKIALIMKLGEYQNCLGGENRVKKSSDYRRGSIRFSNTVPERPVAWPTKLR